MNLEERLRSHMHSGEDLFVEGHHNADDIATRGHRRTRRNQVGGAVAGGVLAFGLVAGAISLSGGGDLDDQLATESDAEVTEAEASVERNLGEVAELGETSDGAAESGIATGKDVFEEREAEEEAADGPEDLQVFDGPIPPFETVIGVDDGFAGLRDTDGSITAITSDDGKTWQTEPTTGIPERATFVSLNHSEGIFAAVFTRFVDGEEQWIGSSTNLVDWQLVPLEDPGGLDVSVTAIEIVDGQILAPGVAFNARAETDEELIGDSRFYVGAPGGPYEARPLPTDAPGALVASADSLILGDGGGLLRSADGGASWTSIDAVPADDFWTIAATDDVVVSVDFENTIRESLDGGATWADAALPVEVGANASVMLLAGPDAIGVFVRSFDATGEPKTSTVLVRRRADWVAVDVSDRIEADVFPNPTALSEDEMIIQIFDDGPVELPVYLRVPTN